MDELRRIWATEGVWGLIAESIKWIGVALLFLLVAALLWPIYAAMGGMYDR